VAFPTETVYGLAADPLRPRAVRRIFRVKGRADAKALTLQVPSAAEALKLVRPDARVRKLARAFWPGPLTIVARARRGKGTVGVRVPAHPFALRLLRSYGKPLAVTSANPSGAGDLRRASELVDFMDAKVEMIFLDPKRRGAKASTVVDLTGPELRILREGPVTAREMAHVLGGN
jgi:L-threonylcarbamoyladenylate synthase